MLPKTYVEGFHDIDAVKKMEYTSFGKTGLEISKLSYGIDILLNGLIHVNLYYSQKHMPPPIKILGAIIFTILIV